MVAINLLGAKFVDRAQSLIVVVLLAVFVVFIAVPIFDIDLICSPSALPACR